MDDPCALRNNGHPSKSENAWLNGAQTGDTVQCSGPFPSDSHSTGVAWPQWDACFPQVAVSDAPPQCQGRGARRPFSAQWAELEKQTPTQTLTHLSRTHTLSCTLHTLGVPGPLSRKFRHEQLRGIREWQVYSRSQQAQRREADWQSSGITTQVEAVCWTKWATCLSASPFPPRGFFRQALCLSLDVYTSLMFPCLISALSFKEQSCIGLRWKKRQFLVKRERKKAALQRRQQNPTNSEKTLQFMSRGAVWGVFFVDAQTFKQTSCWEIFFCNSTIETFVWASLYNTCIYFWKTQSIICSFCQICILNKIYNYYPK